MRRKSATGLSAEKKEKTEKIRVEIDKYICMFVVEISFWKKTSPKNAQNILHYLRFYNGDDFISDDDEHLFKKGYVLIKTELRIRWHLRKEIWLERLREASRKNPRVISAVIDALKENAKTDSTAQSLSNWAIDEIKEMGAEDEY